MFHTEEEFFSLKSTVGGTSQDLSNSTELNRQLVKTVEVECYLEMAVVMSQSFLTSRSIQLLPCEHGSINITPTDLPADLSWKRKESRYTGQDGDSFIQSLL